MRSRMTGKSNLSCKSAIGLSHPSADNAEMRNIFGNTAAGPVNNRPTLGEKLVLGKALPAENRNFQRAFEHSHD